SRVLDKLENKEKQQQQESKTQFFQRYHSRIIPTSRPRLIHQIKPLTIEICKQMWYHPNLQNLLRRTSTAKFRSVVDIWPIGLALYYGLMNKKVVYGQTRSVYYVIRDSTNLNQLFRKIKQGNIQLYCINDIMRTPTRQHLQKYQKLLQT